MKIVIGLGNPGKRYVHTPHNTGFAVIDELARCLPCQLRGRFRFRARMGKAIFNRDELLLVKPETYMNRSGITAARVLRHRKLVPADMIVVLDDADLDIGRLRIRATGGSGGHRGLESVIESVKSEEFTRVRVGIGRDSSGQELVEHVLAPCSPEEQEQMVQAVRRAAQAVLCVVESGVETAMNRFNARLGG